MASIEDCRKILVEIEGYLPTIRKVVSIKSKELSLSIDEGYSDEVQNECRSSLKEVIKCLENAEQYIRWVTEYVKLDFSQPGAEQKISHLRPEFMVDAGSFD